MAKKKNKRTQKGRPQTSRSQGGRVVARPKWENSWNRASTESSKLAWTPSLNTKGVIDYPALESDEKASHEEIFKVLDQLAGQDDGLGTLAVLASIFDKTNESKCDVVGQLRALATTHTASSEAKLFEGYISPDTCNPSDTDSMAGKILRHYRDRNLDELVQAVNTLPTALEKNTSIGTLILTALFTYEVFREENQDRIDPKVFHFLKDCTLPVIGAESFLEILCQFHLVYNLPESAREFLAKESSFPRPEIEKKLIQKKSLIRELSKQYLKWALEIEKEINSTQPTSSLPQCGATFTSAFAEKTSLIAILSSETFPENSTEKSKIQTETTFSAWQNYLHALSPKGFVHKRLQDFTPDDLISLQDKDDTFEKFNHLQNRFTSKLKKQNFSSEMNTASLARWEACSSIVSFRDSWLINLSHLLRHQDHKSAPVVLNKDVLTGLDLFGPSGVIINCQQLVVMKIYKQNLESSESEISNDERGNDPHANYSELELEMIEEEYFSEKQSTLIDSFSKRILDNNLDIVEIRSMEKWMELLSEFYGVSPKKPETETPIPNENTDFSEWLSEAWWCVKHRSWKPIKERPVIEEDETPAKRQPQKQVEDISTTSASENPPLYPKTTVSLIFVGGDWRHAKHDSAVESIIEKKYGDLIEITWNHIDHSNQWHKEQDKICGQLGKADALILSPIIRTTMGWHLRREASKQSIPWIHCPTPGIQGVTKSLEEAVQTVCEIREPNK